MTSTKTRAPTVFAEYAALLRQLHAMIAAATDESDEGDALRDAMDCAWEAMSDKDIHRARALSADLHTLTDPERPLGPSLAAEEWQVRYDDAIRREDWDTALALIRADRGPMSAPEAMFVRARWWFQLDDRDSALVFAEKALQLSPGTWNIAFLRARLLLDLGQEDDAADGLADFVESHPSAVAVEQRATLLKAVEDRRRAIQRSNRELLELAMGRSSSAA